MLEIEQTQASQHAKHLEQLLEISRELTSTMSLEKLLHLIAEAAVELTNTESAAILLQDKEAQTLYFAAVTSHAEKLMTIAVPIDKSIAGAAFTSGKPVIVADVEKDSRYFVDVEQQTGLVARSLLALPLQNKDQPIGVLEVENKLDDRPFDQEDIDILTAFAAQATVAIENVRLTTNLEEVVRQRTLELETAVQQLQQEISKHKQTTSALISAEERWRSLVTNAPARIVTLDQNGTILYTNRVSSTRSQEQVTGTNVYAYLPPEAQNATRQVLASVFHTGTPQKYEICISQENATKIWYENDVAPIYQDGKVAAAIFIATDITHRKQADHLLLEQQKILAVMQERERIAHNLHDGLGQVMGYINLQLQTALDLLAQGHENQLQAILQKLSFVAQDSHTDIRASILGISKKTEISQSFSDALEAYLEDYWQQYDVNIKISLPENMSAKPFAPIVEEQVLRLIQEALTNVRKHAQVKEARLLLLLSDEQVQLIIEDEGIGFELSPHSKPETSDMHFGLDIMQKRAQEVGGKLQIRTASGKGTQIIVQIPRWPESTIEVLCSLRVLLVDDHPLFLEGLQNMLLTKGIQVIGVAHDGLEAQELAFSLRPDLILMDIQMPHCDGVEATRKIKSALPDVKIAMLTIAGDSDTLFSALKFGADGYLLKNLNSDLFLEQLAALARGEVVLAPEVASKVLAEFMQLKEQAAILKPQTKPTLSPEKTLFNLLTPRQQEILKFVAQGMTYKEVGRRLHLTESAIKYHMGNILKQLHLKKQKDAVLFARREGIDKI